MAGLRERQKAGRRRSILAAAQDLFQREGVEDTPIETMMVEFRDHTDALVAACLTDRLADGLSAVYSFFEPGLASRSLGTWMVLWLVKRAAELRLPFVYLGYWVPESRKMAYKGRFRPSEILWGGQWRTLTDAEVETGPLTVPAKAAITAG